MDRGEEQSRRLRVASASETRPFYVFSHRHGVGSNTNVNMVQTSALRSALGPIKAIRFDYLEGTIEWSAEDVGPELTKIFGRGPYFGWYPVTNDSGIVLDGPGDGEAR